MRFERVKNISDARLDGITVDATVVDNAIKSITLSDGIGGVLHITEMYGSLTVSRKAPPLTAKRYRLTASSGGLAVVEHFEERADADERRYAITRAGGDATVEEVTVTISDDGAIIPE